MRTRLLTALLLLLCASAAMAGSIVGEWQLVSIVENGQNITAGETVKDFWKFHADGTVEYRNLIKGKVKSTYKLAGKKLVIKSVDHRPDGVFEIQNAKYKNGKMSWKLEWLGRVLTYNLERK